MRSLHTDYLASTAKVLVDMIPNAWRRWRERREFSEFARLYPAEADCVAHDLGLNTNDLIKISSCGSRWRSLLGQRMRRLGLGVETLTRNQPDVMRDLTICCIRCDSKRRCARDLKTETQSDSWRKYCPNQQTLEALTMPAALILPVTRIVSRP
jgi:hypothetical protein